MCRDVISAILRWRAALRRVPCRNNAADVFLLGITALQQSNKHRDGRKPCVLMTKQRAATWRTGVEPAAEAVDFASAEGVRLASARFASRWQPPIFSVSIPC